jgi:hypothetical protein
MNGSQPNSTRIGRPTRLALYVVGIGVWLTGGLWLLFHYFLVTRGEFGQEANPLEPWWLKLHGAFAFASVWMFGLLWAVHVTPAWPSARRRWSGGVMAGVLAWLILSGYLLYYVGDDKARSIVSVLHWAVGLAVPLFFLSHRVSFRPRRVNGTVNTVSADRYRNVPSSGVQPRVEPRVTGERAQGRAAPHP